MERQTISNSYQHTLASPMWVSASRTGSTVGAGMRINPGPADQGIIFVRAGAGLVDRRVPALWTQLLADQGTTLENAEGVQVLGATRLLMALRLAGVDNATVELTTDIVPLPDGGIERLIEDLCEQPKRRLNSLRHAIAVMRPVEVRDGHRFVKLTPAASEIHRCVAPNMPPSLPILTAAVDAEQPAAWLTRRGADVILRSIGALALVGAPIKARLTASEPTDELLAAALRELFRTRSTWRVELMEAPPTRRFSESQAGAGTFARMKVAPRAPHSTPAG